MRIRNVTVGIDGSADSSAALRWACGLVGPGGQVHAVHVVSTDEARRPPKPGETDPLDAVRALLDGPWTESAESSGVAIKAHLVEDSPTDGILGIAQTVHADLIALGRIGTSGRKRRFIGSVPMGVLHGGEVPFAIVRADALRMISPGATIAVGVGHGHATLAALDWAASFAESHELLLRIVHVVNHHAFLTPSLTTASALEKAAQLIDPDLLRSWVEQDLQKLSDSLKAKSRDGLLKTEWNVAFGRTGQSIVRIADDAVALVLGKRFDGAITGYLTSGTLQYVVAHAPAPVIVVPQRDH